MSELVSLPDSVVVPDEIEPVIGWKGWVLDNDGFLRSQQNLFKWTPGERCSALCLHGPATTIKYEADSEPDGSEYNPPPAYVESPGATGPTGVAPVYASPFTPVANPEPPPIELPRPLRWFYRRREHYHSVPQEECSCGIYLTQDKETALRYGDVLGRCAGWGTVVEHADGYRVQYAYPTELYVSPEQAKMIADYGVPLILRDEDSTPVLASSSPRRSFFWAQVIAWSLLLVLNLLLVEIGPIPVLSAFAASTCGFSLAMTIKGRK